MEVTFRPANINDLDAVQDLFVQTVRSTCKNDYELNQIDAWVSSVENKKRWKSLLSNPYFLIAETEEIIIGFGSLENGDYLDMIYVHKDFLRQGIAQKIFDKLKEQSLILGFEKLTSDVSKTAVPFFVANGFKIIRENNNVRNGVRIINYHMSE